MKKKLVVLSGLVLGLAPVAAFAAATGVISCSAVAGTLGVWVCTIGNILNSVIPVLIALAVIYFIFGVASYVIGADEEAKTKGRDRMIYGIIGVAVIVGMWGLVHLLDTTFGIGVGTANPNIPTVTY